MQSDVASTAGPTASDSAVHDADGKRLAELGSEFNRALDRPARGAVPKGSLRECLRRPLMIALPVIPAVVGAAYYVAEEPYVSTDDAFIRAAKESINAWVSGQAAFVGVISQFEVVMIAMLLVSPLVLFLHKPRAAG
jgi:membrane fusion protein (multidrug efflux system)